MSHFKIAIIGATGVLGHQLLSNLAHDIEGSSKNFEVTAVASKKSIGREVSFGEDQVLKIKSIEAFIADHKDDSEAYDFIFNTMPKTAAEKWSKDLITLSKHYIDLSYASNLLAETKLTSILRKDKQGTDSKDKIFAIPSAASIAVAQLFDVLKENDFAPNRAIATCHYAASENGKAAMDELYDQAKKTFVHQNLKIQHYDKQIAFNMLPVHGLLQSDGQLQSEWLMRGELQKLGHKDVPLSSRVINVPVFIGTTISLYVEFDREEILSDDVKKKMSLENNLILVDRQDRDNAFTSIDCAGQDQILVSRVSEDWSSENAINFWLGVDNLNLRTMLAIKLMFSLI